MGRFHYSLAGLGGGIALLCVHLAAWISHWHVAGAISAALLVGLTGLAVCGAIVCRDDRRAFWTGVAVFGAAFCYTSMPQGRSQQQPYYPVTFYGYANNPQSQTTDLDFLFDWVESQMGSSFRVGDRVKAIWMNSGWYSGVITANNGDGTYDVKWDDGSPVQRTAISQIQSLTWGSRTSGRSLLGTLIAFGGGIASAMFFGGKKEQKGSDERKPADQPKASNSQ